MYVKKQTFVSNKYSNFLLTFEYLFNIISSEQMFGILETDIRQGFKGHKYGIIQIVSSLL